MSCTDDLILFTRVVELGSFSRAAEELSMTASVVSKHIARLEEALGVQLLYRTTRRLRLTEAGEQLYLNGREIRQLSQEAFEQASGFGQQVKGHLKISVPTISGELLLARAVAEFCAQHPKLSIDMSMDNRFVDVIGEGYDLAIRTGFLEDSSLISRHIIDSQWVVCASPSYLKRRGVPNTPQSLANHACLLYDYHTEGAREWHFKAGRQTYTVQVTGGFSTDNAAALRQAALAGFGVIYVPRCLVHLDLVSGRLTQLFSGQVAKSLGVFAIYPFTRHPPFRIQHLIEHIRQAYLEMAEYFRD
uniref:LysR family transcriptional regulator n=1 Tax=Thaumasiovibrio occultus TaxID=1891184 RepID=UPI000B34C21A|nr:LysR family transcriptional regulator [Thaumasiovibrio occultus]